MAKVPSWSVTTNSAAARGSTFFFRYPSRRACRRKRSVPAIQSFNELLDESRETGGGGEEGRTQADGAPAGAVEPTETANDDDEAGRDATDADRTIVVGEAEATYDHALEDQGLMDPSYEELWEGTDAIKIDLPDIPALDLDWGDEDDHHQS